VPDRLYRTRGSVTCAWDLVSPGGACQQYPGNQEYSENIVRVHFSPHFSMVQIVGIAEMMKQMVFSHRS
jgi:hypothetical protein